MYYNIEDMLAKQQVFNIVIGGRGIGKTYSALKMLRDSGKHFIYLRRLQTEIDIVATESANPFKVINRDFGDDFKIVANKIKCIMNGDTQVGYAIALSTFSNLRGVDFSDVDIILFDEFIPEKTRKSTIKNESDAFFNLYESVNRNREFQGKSPVLVIMLSNAVSIFSPLLLELGITEIIEKMLREDSELYIDKKRSILINIPKSNSISELKKETVLYKLTSGTKFNDHAIENKFCYDSWYNVRKRNIVEYIPICSIDGVYIYRHKNNGTLYACFNRADCPEYTSEDTYSIFKRNHWIYLHESYVSGKMYFQNMVAKKIIESVI